MGTPHALGLSCLTVAWGRVARDEPLSGLSLVTAGTATASGTSGVSGLKAKPSGHSRSCLCGLGVGRGSFCTRYK